jgi:integral membrane protein
VSTGLSHPTRSARPVPPGVILRYRAMAYITGVLLLVLVFIAVPVKYLGHDSGPVAVVGTLHGWMYFIYLLAAFHLSHVVRWPVGKTILVLLAGTVPFASFVAERKIVHELSGRTPITAAAGS